MEQPDWLERLRAGDPGAMEGLLVQYGPMMEYIVRGVLSDPHEAEDCLAQVRARLWEKAPSDAGPTAVAGPWRPALRRSAPYPRLRGRARREGRQGELSPELADPAPGPEEEVLRRERAEALRRVLNTLKAADLRLFYRKYYYLQPTDRIAAELGTTPRAVEGRLYRIRKRLQEQLGGDAL